MDSRQHHRWHSGRIRPHPACQHEFVCTAGWRRRRSDRDAQTRSAMPQRNARWKWFWPTRSGR